MITFEEYLNERVYKGLKADLTKGVDFEELYNKYVKYTKSQIKDFEGFLRAYKTMDSIKDYFAFINHLTGYLKIKPNQAIVDFYQAIIDNKDMVENIWDNL